MNKYPQYDAELNELIKQGNEISFALNHENYPDSFRANLLRVFDNDEKKVTERIKKLPHPSNAYQSWYSKAYAVIKQVLPDRLSDFASYYEEKKGRKSLTPESYRIKDYLHGLSVTQHNGKTLVDGSAAIPLFQQQLQILKAARDSLSSVLIDLEGLLQADLFDSEIDSAASLAKAGYLRAAGALCGVVIEKHLKHVNDLHNLTIKKNPGIADLSQSLKEAGVITMPQWRQIQHLADIRNLCSHAKSDEPSKDDIQDLVDGTKKILKTVY